MNDEDTLASEQEYYPVLMMDSHDDSILFSLYSKRNNTTYPIKETYLSIFLEWRYNRKYCVTEHLHYN